jgi:hypothetical protein
VVQFESEKDDETDKGESYQVAGLERVEPSTSVTVGGNWYFWYCSFEIL